MNESWNKTNVLYCIACLISSTHVHAGEHSLTRSEALMRRKFTTCVQLKNNIALVDVGEKPVAFFFYQIMTSTSKKVNIAV